MPDRRDFERGHRDEEPAARRGQRLATAGGEVLGALVVAVHGPVPVAELRTMIYAYPTFHRAIEAAVEDLGGH